MSHMHLCIKKSDLISITLPVGKAVALLMATLICCSITSALHAAGQGYAGVAIADGKMYTLGDDIDGDKNEFLTCFNQADGKFEWKFKTGSPWKNGKPSWQHSRSTPTVDGDRVYVLTPFGVLWCVGTDGKEKWQVNLKEKFGAKKAEQWGYSESVLIDGDNLICTPLFVKKIAVLVMHRL